MELNIHGKNALVTGGSHGIGRAIALGLAAEGCNVAICATTPARVADVAEGIQAHGVQGVGLVADVMEPGAVERVVTEARRSLGGLSILVNNVGGGGRWGSLDILETREGVWAEVYEKNALVAARFTTACLPDMVQAGWGRVVAVSSLYGREGGGRPWFNMAKAAQISMMKCLAMDRSLSRRNITFNTVAPGPVMIEDTGWARERDADPSGFQAVLEQTMTRGRLGTPEEVACVVVFLCSRQAALVNGACIAADGGDGRAF